MRRYTVVIGKTDVNHSANLPDPPCCVATADTVEAIEAEIRDAIRIHVEGRAAGGLPLPAPTSIVACIEAQHCVSRHGRALSRPSQCRDREESSCKFSARP